MTAALFITRRRLLETLAAFLALGARTGAATAGLRPDQRLVIVNGWILRDTDLALLTAAAAARHVA